MRSRVSAPRAAPDVPFSEIGHHLGAPENIQLHQVGWIQFQAVDIDARVL